jgi:hypothetical protein
MQIALGALVATLSDHAVTLDPAVFFLLFLPPLLFSEGICGLPLPSAWETPRSEKLKRQRLSLCQLRSSTYGPRSQNNYRPNL